MSRNTQPRKIVFIRGKELPVKPRKNILISSEELQRKRSEVKPKTLYDKYILLSPYDYSYYEEFVRIEKDRANDYEMTVREWLNDAKETEKLRVAILLNMTAQQWVVLQGYMIY